MNHHSRLVAFRPKGPTVFIVLLGCLLLLSPSIAWSQKIPKAKAPAKEDKIPSDLTAEQVDGYVAGLSDEQARKVLYVKLKEEAAAKSRVVSKEQVIESDKGFVLAFFGAQKALSTLSERIGGIFTPIHAFAGAEVWEKNSA